MRGGTTPVRNDSASGHTRTTHAPADRSHGTAQPAPTAATRSARAATTATAGASTKLPPLPERFTKAGLAAVGFEGWRTWPQLRSDGYDNLPSLPGVYVVLAATGAKPTWAHPGTGGRFKDQEPIGQRRPPGRRVGPGRQDAVHRQGRHPQKRRPQQ